MRLAGLLILAGLVLAGCIQPTPTPSASSNAAITAVATATLNASATVTATPSLPQNLTLPKARDLGDFKIVYLPTSNPDYNQLRQIFQANRLFEDTIVDLNNAISLPSDVPIEFKECGIANAFYDPATKSVSMCYELVDDIYTQLSDNYQTAEELDGATINATYFLLYHELGHALIHVLNLDVLGNEEDAADNIATIISIQSGREDAALNAAIYFYGKGIQYTNIKQLPFWNEHSLDQTRFYNIVCLVLGSNPVKYEFLVPDPLPAERAVRCESEYVQKTKSLYSQLNPYLK